MLGAGRESTTGLDFSATHPDVLDAMQFYEKLSRVTAGAQLLVVYLPLSYVVHKEDESRWRHLGMRDVSRQIAFDSVFVRHLNERQIPAIDLTQNLQKSTKVGQRAYFWLDMIGPQLGIFQRR